MSDQKLVLNAMRARIVEEVENRAEFSSRQLAVDLVQLWTEKDPHFLDVAIPHLVENQIMQWIDAVVREKRVAAMQRLRAASATQRRFKLLVAAQEAQDSLGGQQERQRAVIEAAHDLWDQSVTVAKNRRIKLKSCTAEDLQFLVDRFKQRADSFTRNALFYMALRDMVSANGEGTTVDDLPMSSLQKLTEKLDESENIVKNDVIEKEEPFIENIEEDDDDLDVAIH